jgi:hypothetical protein
MTAHQQLISARQVLDQHITSGPTSHARHLIVTPDGGWRVELEDPAAGDLTAQWEASVCVGRFFGPDEAANRLEWSAEQGCTGNYAPQHIKVRLQSTCPDWWCVRSCDISA